MPKPLVIHKGRTNIIPVGLGFDVSGDDFKSEIRDSKSELIAEFEVTFLTDGTDGELILTLDNSESENIDKTYGFMDIKRVSNGEPLSVFNGPLQVVFKSVVTQ